MSGKMVDGWIPVYKCGTDYEADLVKDRLVDAGIPAVILTHRDHAFNLNVGDMSTVKVLVSPLHESAAMQILRSVPISGADLEAAALAADPVIDDDDPD